MACPACAGEGVIWVILGMVVQWQNLSAVQGHKKPGICYNWGRPTGRRHGNPPPAAGGSVTEELSKAHSEFGS